MSIPFSRVDIGYEEKQAVSRVMDSGWLAAGPETEAFEREFAEYVGVKYAIFTNSCTSALKMAYNIAKERGFTGICYPKNTFVATYSAAAELGLAICPQGGYDGDIWQHSPRLPVPDAEKYSKTYTTVSEGSSVPSGVTGQAEKVSGSPLRLSTGQESQGILRPSSLRGQKTGSTGLGSIGQPTSGLKETTGKRLSAMSVEKLKELVGRTKTTPMSENVINGRDYARSAIMNTTEYITGRTSVHFGSIKDESPCLIEDSAHRIEQEDPLVGLMRCYSFYATKNITTGSGGMFTTDNTEVYELARTYWRDGLTTATADRQRGPVDYEVKRLVSGYDGNDLAAAMGRVQLRRLPGLTARRNEVRDRYNAAFGRDWMGNHLYCLDLASVERVGECRRFLWDRGIGSGYHYPGTGWTSVSLPIYPLLNDQQQDAVIGAVREGGYA